MTVAQNGTGVVDIDTFEQFERKISSKVTWRFQTCTVCTLYSFFFFELLSQDNDSDDTHPSLHQEFNEETYIEALCVIPSWDIN